MAVECPVSEHCTNCGNRCEICIGAYAEPEWESAELCELALHYAHKFGAPNHPYTEWKKRRRREARDTERDRKRTPDYKKKSRTVKRALKTEEKTRRAVVQATKRSGALNGDGDTRLEGTGWGIDDKYHSTARTRVSVNVTDLEKAARQKCLVVVTLAGGEKYVIARLEDFVAAAGELAEALQTLAEPSIKTRLNASVNHSRT